MKTKVPVIYRVIQGELLALLPSIEANFGMVVCYAHIGQHSEAHINYAQSGRLATEAEYQDLHKELKCIYECDGDIELVIRKRVRTKNYPRW